MILSNAFVSDPRVEKEAVALVGAGWDVTVLAWDREGDAPSSELRRGIRIERFGPRARHGGGLANGPLYRAFWAEATERALALEPDVVHCHDLDTAPAGLGVLRGSSGPRLRLVLDFHELYRESNMVPQRGLAGLAARGAVRWVERRAIPAADAVLVANPGTMGYYERFSPRGEILAIENAPELTRFRPRGGPAPERPFTVGFMGQKRYIEGLRLLMDVVQAQPDVAAFLAGGGTAAAEVAELASRRERVDVSGAFTYEELPALYERCDCVYAVYDAGLGNVRTLFPVKVMEAMACELPVIVAAGTWVGEYVVEHGIGLAVEPGDAGSLAEAVAALKDDPGARADMGRRGRAIVEAGLNWEAVASRLVAAYDRLRP